MNTATKRKLTVMLDAEVYDALRCKVGARGMGALLSELARPYVVKSTLDSEYKAMSLDVERESEAQEWIVSDTEDSDAENVWRF